MIVGIGVYFITIIVLAAGFDLRLMLPFLAWLVLYGARSVYFVPRLGRVGKAQADARAMMTGRITDAYTNISTVKLFSHTQREAGFARAAMQEFKTIGYQQMRLVSTFEIVNHALVVGLILGAAGYSLWLWSLGQVGPGAVAAVTAMALRINGMSHWIMWEMASLFENIGTVQDGIGTLTRPRRWSMRPMRSRSQVTRGEVRSTTCASATASRTPVIDDFTLTREAGREDRPDRPLGRRQVDAGQPAAALLRPGRRPHPDRRPGHRHVTQDSLRSHIGMVTQDTSLLHRSVRDNIAYGRPGAPRRRRCAPPPSARRPTASSTS